MAAKRGNSDIHPVKGRGGSSIDFAPSLYYTPRPSIVPQNESRPSAIPLAVPVYSCGRTSNALKVKVASSAHYVRKQRMCARG